MSRDVLDDRQRLLCAFLRAQAHDDPVSEFYARLTVDMSTLSRELRNAGVRITEKWENHDHLKIKARGLWSPVDFHLKATHGSDEQTPIVTVLTSDEPEAQGVSFFLPEQCQDAIGYVINAVITALPEKALQALFERIPHKDPSIIREVRESGCGDADGRQKAFDIACINRGIELK